MNFARMLIFRLLVVFSILIFTSPAQATNYITSVGTQQFSITVASGSLTGTASINPVGSGAFIIWQGENSNETGGQLDDSHAYITWSGTTITATRGVTGSSKSITVNGVIIDGDTTNLIKSVQCGTVSNASLSATGTVAISSVVNNNTALVMLGDAYSGSITNVSDSPIISLSGTTVTINIVTSPGPGFIVTAGFCAIEFQGTALNSHTQNIAYSATKNGASDTSTISNVTTGNSWLAYGGWHSAASNNPSEGQPNFQLTGKSTITYTWNTSSSFLRKFNSVVVEFVSSVLHQSVQRGTIALSSTTSNTATVSSSVVTNGFCNWLMNNTTLTSVDPDVGDYNITQTNATTLTMQVTGAATGTGSYELVEFPAFSSGLSGNSLNALWFGMPP